MAVMVPAFADDAMFTYFTHHLPRRDARPCSRSCSSCSYRLAASAAPTYSRRTAGVPPPGKAVIPFTAILNWGVSSALVQLGFTSCKVHHAALSPTYLLTSF